MFVKLAVLACSLAVAIAAYNGPQAGGQPAAQFPAGIDPASCPNFPVCDNPLVAISQGPHARAYQQAQPQYQQQPQQYQAPQQYQQQPAQQYQQQPAAPQYQQFAPAQQYQARQPQPQPQQSLPISQYNPVLASQYQPAQSQQYTPEVQNALDQGKYIGDGDYHGEGLAEALAPGYQRQAAAPQYQPQYQRQAAAPQYQQPAQQYAQQPQYPVARAYSPAPAPAGHAQPAQIPAGVDPNACPNYPYCH
ncbi:unnamed protein product [Brassicogethes aeneus]|uniref:Cuticle protein CPCFC domain-containing protein n=1 Tax=Brassicogethes aeneus TaxID=1431903 RepID=A0A9P0FG67_BRAAE|nr:unnamed protein product [Brassicogethes aeneus]